MTSRDFPHEPTSDQFFSETQFECYRALGAYLVSRIVDGAPRKSPPDPTSPSPDWPFPPGDPRFHLTTFWHNATHVMAGDPTTAQKLAADLMPEELGQVDQSPDPKGPPTTPTPAKSD